MTTTIEHWSNQLVRLGATCEAVPWAATQPSLESAWAACERPDWMLWLIGKTTRSLPYSPERRPLVGCACECARLSLPILEARFPNDNRVRHCLDIHARWAAGEDVDENDLRAAKSSAAAAYADAADAAAYAAYAAAAAAYAANAAAPAAAAAYAARARKDIQAACCEIIRKWFPKPPDITKGAD